MPSIKKDIAAWNGKSADHIGQIYERHCHDPAFVSTIIKLASEEPVQNGATWLLKRHVEKGVSLEPSSVKGIYHRLPQLQHWQAKLHVLQCMPHLPIPKSHRAQVETFLRHCLIDEIKFVRAWAYGGFYELASQYPQYQEEVEQFFKMAMRDEPASVVARVRRVMKKGF